MTDNKKYKLFEQWIVDKKKAVEIMHDGISTPTKYIELNKQYTESEIKKVLMLICDNLKKDNIPTDWDQLTITRATQITRYYADLIKSKKDNKETSILGKNKQFRTYSKNSTTTQNTHNTTNKQINNSTNQHNETTTESDKDKKTEEEAEKEDENDNNNGKDKEDEQQKENKRKTTDDNDDEVIIDEEALIVIKDQDNVNPTKRQKTISKNYMQDDDKLPTGWHKVQQLETRPVVLIKQIGNKDINTTKQIITNTLEEESRDYGEVEQVSKTQKVVVIHFEDITNRDKFMKYTRTFQKEWICEIPKLKNPCIRITGVSIKADNNREIDWNAWLDKLLNKNRWIPKTKDSVFKINFKNQKNNKWSIVFEVSPNIRQAIIQKKGKIFTGLQKHEVYDTFNIYTCYNCSAYGHTTNQCGQQPVCRYCARQHFTKCSIKDQPEKYKCHACKNTGHAFNDPTCPQFLWRLKHELQFINMNYEIIMTPSNQQQ